MNTSLSGCDRSYKRLTLQNKRPLKNKNVLSVIIINHYFFSYWAGGERGGGGLKESEHGDNSPASSHDVDSVTISLIGWAELEARVA